MLILTLFISGTTSSKSFGNSNSTCAEAANAASKDCERETEGAFWQAVGSCVTFPDQVTQEACIRIAYERRKQAKSVCVDRFRTKLKSCEARPKTHSGDPTDQYPQNPGSCSEEWCRSARRLSVSGGFDGDRGLVKVAKMVVLLILRKYLQSVRSILVLTA